MFKVKISTINSTTSNLIHDEKTSVNVVYNATVNIEVNKSGTFTFAVAPNHPYYDELKIRKTLVDVYQDESVVFCGIITSIVTDFYKQKKVTCEGLMTLFNDTIQRPSSTTGTARSIIETLLTNHNSQIAFLNEQITIGTIDSIGSNTLTIETNMSTTMSALQNIVKLNGGFMRIRKANNVIYFDYVSAAQNTNKQIVKIGSNLMDFNKNYNLNDVCSYIIPVGATLENPTVANERVTISSVNSGKDYLSTGITDVGNIYTVVEFSDITDPSVLKSKAENYIASMSAENICIEVKAFDLSITNDAFESFKLLDSVRIISSPHGIDNYYPLTKMKININDPSKNTITLGEEKIKTISEQVKGD